MGINSPRIAGRPSIERSQVLVQPVKILNVDPGEDHTFFDERTGVRQTAPYEPLYEGQLYINMQLAGANRVARMYVAVNLAVDVDTPVDGGNFTSGQVAESTGLIVDGGDFSAPSSNSGPRRYSPQVPQTNLLDGQWRGGDEIISVSDTDADGVTINPWAGLGVGDSFFVSADNGEFIEQKIGPQFTGGVSYFGGFNPRYTVGLDTTFENFVEDRFAVFTEIRIATSLADVDASQTYDGGDFTLATADTNLDLQWKELVSESFISGYTGEAFDPMYD